MNEKNNNLMAYLASLSKEELFDFLKNNGVDFSGYPVDDDGYPDIVGIAQKKDGSLVVYFNQITSEKKG